MLFINLVFFKHELLNKSYHVIVYLFIYFFFMYKYIFMGVHSTKKISNIIDYACYKLLNSSIKIAIAVAPIRLHEFI